MSCNMVLLFIYPYTFPVILNRSVLLEIQISRWSNLRALLKLMPDQGHTGSKCIVIRCVLDQALGILNVGCSHSAPCGTDMRNVSIRRSWKKILSWNWSCCALMLPLGDVSPALLGLMNIWAWLLSQSQCCTEIPCS